MPSTSIYSLVLKASLTYLLANNGLICICRKHLTTITHNHDGLYSDKYLHRSRISSCEHTLPLCSAVTWYMHMSALFASLICCCKTRFDEMGEAVMGSHRCGSVLASSCCTTLVQTRQRFYQNREEL